MPKNIFKLREQLCSKKSLWVLGSGAILLLLGGAGLVVHAQYGPGPIAPPVVISTLTLSTDQNSLSFTVTGGTSLTRAGFLQGNCGEDIDGTPPNFTDRYVGGLVVDTPYKMDGPHSYQVVDTTIMGSVSPTMTASGRIGDGCDDSSRHGENANPDYGAVGAYSGTVSGINVSALGNDTHTLRVTMCTQSGTCSTSTRDFVINNRSTATPNFYFTVTPSSRTIEQGQTTTYDVGVVCSGGLAGPIGNLSVSNLQTGATPSWGVSSPEISCGGSRTLTINTNSTAQTGTRTLTIQGTATGGSGPTRSTTTNLTINQGPEVLPDETCDIQVISNIATDWWYIGGDGFQTAITGSGTGDTYPPDAGHPQQLGDGFGISFADMAGYTKEHITSNQQTCTSTADPNNTVVFEVRYTATTTPPPTPPGLSCSASPTSVPAGQGVTFTPTNGNGTYSWSAPGGSPSSGTGGTLNTSYSTTGTKTVTVTSGGVSANCTVTVTSPPTNPICSPSSQTVAVGQTVNFGTAPSGSYGLWYSPDGTPVRQSHFTSPTYSTTYSTPGNKTVYYNPNGGYPDTTCAVNVVARPTVDLRVSGGGVTNSNGPINIAHNGSATLSWTTTNSPTSCTATGSWSGSKAIGGGSEGTGALTRPPSTRTYSISCTNSAGTSAVDSVTVNVGAQPTGTVVVNSVTSDGDPIATTWDITGAAFHQQTTAVASRTYTSQPTGTYSFFPDDLPGYTKSVNSVSQTLNADLTITFIVTYTPTVTECGDGVDNDGDGFIDDEDPACDGGGDGEDPPNNPQCSDGIDNDGDGKIDYNADPGCDSNDDNDESDDPMAPEEGGPDFSLSSSNNLSIDKDAGETTSNSTTIRVNPLAGFGADVTLSILSGPSAPVTYNFSDTTITSSEYGAGTGETLSVTITPEFPRGNYPIVVQGEGGGLTRTRTVILSVDEQGPTFQEF